MTTIRIHRKLEGETIQLPEAKSLIGKNVEITVREVAVAGANGTRIWRHLGSVDLGGKADGLNLRALAYE